MKIQEDKMIFSGRRDIELMQNMIEVYLDTEDPDESDIEMLESLNGQLDSLWFAW